MKAKELATIDLDALDGVTGGRLSRQELQLQKQQMLIGAFTQMDASAKQLQGAQMQAYAAMYGADKAASAQVQAAQFGMMGQIGAAGIGAMGQMMGSMGGSMMG